LCQLTVFYSVKRKPTSKEEIQDIEAIKKNVTVGLNAILVDIFDDFCLTFGKM
jgi:hypothetical protein